MSTTVDLERVRHQVALRDWLEDCRQRWANRYPLVAFDANEWPLRTIQGTSNMQDESLGQAFADFAGRDASFSDVLRCIAAEIAMTDSIKSLAGALVAVRLLKTSEAQTIFDLSLADLRKIEGIRLKHAETHPMSATSTLGALSALGRHVDRLSLKGVIPRIVYAVRRDVRAKLLGLTKIHRERARSSKALVLDHQIEALSEATKALFHGDSRLSPADRVAIAALNLEMCAPSRVNEILCLAIDDHVALEDYAARVDGQDQSGLHNVHQMLIITMKGSKGAQWGAKPVLSFMIDLFNLCLNIILKHGERSRMLVTWYQRNPNMLFLPPELEHLRGKDIDRNSLWQIVNLTSRLPEISTGEAFSVRPLFYEMRAKGMIKQIPNPRPRNRETNPTVQGFTWTSVEACLLNRVKNALNDCRQVTPGNSYEGDLSNMLFLFDSRTTPYLPGSLTYKVFRRRLKHSAGDVAADKKRGVKLREPTLFERLGITMSVDGRVQLAWIDTHDPRRWLTTTALAAREKLPDVLINKWARRLSIDQLKHYDLRTAEQRAEQSRMPAMLELNDLSKGIESARVQEERCGLKTEIVTVHDAGISVTSMDAIAAAVEQRPIAKTSEQLFIIYPSWFGACIHQHHETPCRAYSASCLPCDNNLVVKGHLPTNEAVRQREKLLYGSIVEQLEKLVMAQNRGVPDDPAALDEHLLTLVRHGLDPKQMADDIITRFHEIKHLLKDVCFANKLEEAFVATGMVVRLDDPKVANGALIKYHNPTRHAAPGGERAWDAHGGRAKFEEARERLIHMHPRFAPTAEGLSDQRALIPPDDDEEDAIEGGNEAGSEAGYE